MEGRTVIYLGKRKITVKKPLLISGKKVWIAMIIDLMLYTDGRII